MAEPHPKALESLRSLRSGALEKWSGLVPESNRQDVETVFGDTGPGPGGVAFLGDELCAFRDYPSTDFAPYGFTIWFSGSVVRCVEINSPNVPPNLQARLGVPEAILPSRLRAFHDQWIYASRGLTVHVSNRTHAVTRLYGYASTTVEQFLTSGLSRVEIRRIPLRH